MYSRYGYSEIDHGDFSTISSNQHDLKGNQLSLT